MAFEQKPAPARSVILPDDFELEFPANHSEQKKFWENTRRLFMEWKRVLEGLTETDTSGLSSSITALTTRVTALEAITQAGLIRDVNVHPDAQIKESKLKLNFPTHSPTNDPTTDQKHALNEANNPSASNPLVTLSQLNSLTSSSVPVGTVIPFAGSTVPAGWLDCNGASLLRSVYYALYAVIGTTYGAVDGTHFNLPDSRGRTIIGVGTGSGLTARALGDTGGFETHTLTEDELPSVAAGTPAFHNWANAGMSSVDGNHRVLVDTDAEGGTTYPHSSVTDFPLLSFGSDDPHNNMQPFIALKLIIKI